MAGTGAATLTAGFAGDQLYANGKAGDTLIAGGGQTTLSAVGSTGDNLLVGYLNGFAYGAGDEIIATGGGVDTVQGGSGAATIFGGSGTTDLLTGGGNEEFVAGSGNESIQGTGNLTAFVGKGSAEFGLAAGRSGGDMLTIYGFKLGADLFHLTGYGSTNPLSTITEINGTTRFTLSDNTHVTVVNVVNLTSASFV